MNLRMDLAYDGAPFHGFARQPGLRTIQGDLEYALQRVLRRDLQTACAGRTDAGVHALAQVVGVPEVPDDADPEALANTLNLMLGPSIAITASAPAAEGWHPRFSARSRSYTYAVVDGRIPDPFVTRTAWHHRDELDIAAMNEAAGHLVGEHDFISFGRVPEVSSSDRTLFELRARRSGRLVLVHARANAFIQQMVRSLVGTLVQVGSGRRSPADMPDVLLARDRSAAGPVAPPHGLCLVAVEYDEGWSRPVEV